ncbi:MAG: type IX secretion system sortase PorU [Paludibacteraceae bacterium]|nr:type IX secretion system sortase PorU [Paludibacteraceae bacterium]
MRRTLNILLMLCLVMPLGAAHNYVASSALSSGNIVKIQVPGTGIYMIGYEQLQQMGLNPSRVRLLGYGGNLIEQNFTLPRIDDVPSIPFYMHTGADGVFGTGDYILFYANGPQGWNWDKSSKSYKRTQNCYADYGCYFLSDEAGEQRLLAMSDTLADDAPLEVETYTALQLHELDQRNLIDVDRGEGGGGREWYGEVMTYKAPKLTIPFTFANVVTDANLLCRVDAAATANVLTSMNVKTANGNQTMTFTQSSSGQHVYATTATCNLKTPSTGNSMSVTLHYQCANNTDVAYLNYIEMQVPCSLILRGNCLEIRNTDHVGSPSLSRYHLLGADSNTQVWNMTHPEQAYQVRTTWQGDTLCWLGSNQEPQLFLAVQVNSTAWSTPASRGRVANQNLHKQLQGVQHVIFTPDAFRPAAEKLKQAHELYAPSEKWCVVSDEEVYNEFSSGTPDASAIRWMMKYIYDTAPNETAKPKSLLLLGDGSFDNRQILKSSPKPVVLTYQAINSTVETSAYATDDYFGWLEDNDGIVGTNRWDDKSAVLRIGVGRLPANTYEQAEQMVNKLSTYLSNSAAGKWKQQLCFLADDGDHGTHVTTADVGAQAIAWQAPSFAINKIYLDAYEQETSASGESYPLAYNTFCNLLQTGVLFMDYAGHGSPNNICSEMFLTRKQVEEMNNTHQGLWALATCNFSKFDQTAVSTAEVAVLNPIGGAIGVISSDRTVYASYNTPLNQYLCANLFYHTDEMTYPYSIGEALRLAKNQFGNRDINKLPYLLLGDPALRLSYPSQYQVKVSDMPATLHALDLVTINGYISNGDTLASARRDTVDFNGELAISVYDKEQTVATRDNDEPTPEKKTLIYFQDYPNILFSGNAAVTDGKFTVTFRMPKDIRYNTGAGRITLYANGQVDSVPSEAIGHNEQFMVGGSSPIVIDDQQGPDIEMWLNTPAFHSGDMVNSTPHFFAKLYDENGINTVGSGIGHDLQLILDNSQKQTFILNNYYTAENNSYQQGTVSYILPELSNGNHSLSFRAWDMLNNATTKSLSFTVDNDMGPNVQQMVVYPNPVSQFGTLNMYLTHDRPDDLMSIDIAFYDMIGQKVWSTYRSLYGTTISFDMTEAALPPGTYIYQFTIQTATQSSSKHSGRIIVY